MTPDVDLEAEVRAWRDLEDSIGWGKLQAHARDQYDGDAFVRLLEKAAFGEHAAQQIRDLFVARAAVRALLRWPREQRQALTRVPDGPLAMPGRRGRL